MDTNTKSVRFFKGYRLLKEVNDIVAINIVRWHTYGQFEFHLPEMEPYIELDNRVMFDRDPYKAGIIKYINTEDSGAVTIKGYSLLWLLGHRITVPDTGKDYLAYNAPEEDIMVDLVKKCAVSPEDGKRRIPGLVVEPSKGRGRKAAYQTRYDNLAEVLEELSRASMLGICIRMDLEKGRDVFEVLEGKDLSMQQDRLPPVIFRRGYDNILSAEYTLNDVNTRTCAYTLGQGEGADRAVYIVGNELEGLERKELCVDARDIENAAELPARGQIKLADCVRQESFEVEVPEDWYKSRWNLGDLVTVIDEETGITLEHYISEIREEQDENGYCVVPTFGIPERSVGNVSGSGIGGGGMSQGGGDAAYVYTQTTPAKVWEIRHNLGKYPAVTVTDSKGSLVFGELQYVDRNLVTIHFSKDFAGHANLN